MRVGALFPRLAPAHIATYTGLFVFMQTVYVCADAHPEALQVRGRLSARLLFLFALSVAAPCALLTLFVTDALLTRCACRRK